uniref:C2H2-type domain-containing protein n=1 Tax=Romanomermis culicivorax TaxID=13658 RepID=A0A915ID74_ROMCU
MTTNSTATTVNGTNGVSSTVVNVKDASKYAVIRLKNSDNLISLFQLLLQNGYTQVSFVNSLNETIFPFIERLEKCTQTSTDFYNSGNLNFKNGVALSNGHFSGDIHQRIFDNNNSKPGVICTTSGGASAAAAAANLFFDNKQLSRALNDFLPNFAAAAGFLGLPTLPSIFSSTTTTANNNGLATTHDLLATNKLMNESNYLNNNGNLKRRLDLAANDSNFNVVKKSNNANENGNVLNDVFSTATNTQLRQRGQRGYAEDPSLYVTCRLCKNKIMGSRISNLTNHVRRHSSLKQFQCCYCEYTHNEMAKVRLHMLHNHKDKDSQPIDNLSPEMQNSWEFLMKECFPEQYQANFNNNTNRTGGPNSKISFKSDEISMVRRQDLLLNNDNNLQNRIQFNSSSDSATLNSDTKDNSSESNAESPLILSNNPAPKIESNVTLLDTFPCLECGELIAVKDQLEHIYSRHLNCQIPAFVCSLCGFDDATHEKLKLHVDSIHKSDLNPQILTRNVDQIIEHLLPQFFPGYIAAILQFNQKPLVTAVHRDENSETVRNLFAIVDDRKSPENAAIDDSGAKRPTPAPYNCPKCHFISGSRRKIINHLSKCSSIFPMFCPIKLADSNFRVVDNVQKFIYGVHINYLFRRNGPPTAWNVQPENPLSVRKDSAKRPTVTTNESNGTNISRPLGYVMSIASRSVGKGKYK